MNRETKRLMQRQGQMEADGSPSSRRSTTTTQRRPSKQRATPVEVGREIREELRQVAWPSRNELANYTAVVLTVLLIMIFLIFALNYVIGKGIIWLFST